MGADPLIEGQEDEIKRKITRPRPGHADLNGAIKYGHHDMRNVLERSSARETTVRVAAGGGAKKLLSLVGVNIVGHVVEIAGIKAEFDEYLTMAALKVRTENSPVRTSDPHVEQ